MKTFFINTFFKKNFTPVCVLTLLLSANLLNAQNRKYLVLLKDKNNSTYSVSKPAEFLSARAIERRKKQNISLTERDLPVNQTYLKSISATGATVRYTSKWMNAVLIEADTAKLRKVLNLSFVKGIEGNTALDSPFSTGGRIGQKTSTKGKIDVLPDYGNSLSQVAMISANEMHRRGFHGEGMLIAVLDEGFLNATTLPCFKSLFDEKRVVDTYDFVGKDKNVYDTGSHGTAVLSTMAAYVEKELIGTAYKASFALFRTEDSSSESLVEEANWLFATEYADSLGVDVLNSSLGYNEFDEAQTNHVYADMNGKKTIAARAASWAAKAGIVCVISAGNEGNKSWKYITTPADADSIITVGAVDRNQAYASFSSLGPSADGRIKPDLSDMGQSAVVAIPSGGTSTANGTSFSSPILCGMVAGFWQSNPTLTAMQVIDFLRKSGSQFTKPDAFLGYGIPSFERAEVLAKNILAAEKEIQTGFKIFPNPFSSLQNPSLENEQYDGRTFYASLIDIYGKILWNGEIKNEVESLPFQSFSPGIYFLKIYNEKQNSTLKIIKNTE